MPRLERTNIGDMVYHVINRANARVQIFDTEKDYTLFEKLLDEAKKEVVPVRILSYCIMPNHWHLVLYPTNDGDLSEFMRWITVTHTMRWHVMHGTSGLGHLYQGRFKSFPVETDAYFLTLCRYVEQNALRAKMVGRAEEWQWSSLWRRVYGNAEQQKLLSEWPVPITEDYLQWVNELQSKEDLGEIRECVKKNRPYGSAAWTGEIAKKFKLESTFRDKGRPRVGK